jgi:molybdate transport system substrate-binding protein
MQMIKRIIATVVLTLILAVPALAGEISLSVAASLRESVTELSDLFQKRTPGVSFKKNFGASGALAKQIEAGAPADLFFSANNEWVDYLIKKKLADEKSVGVFAYNQLVVVGRPDLKITSMQDLVKLNRIAIGSPKSVPAGEYAMAALTKSGVDKQVEKKLVMAKDVRECLLYADRGEVDAAFVYKTDALLLAKQATILYVAPENLHDRVTYPMTLTMQGIKKPEAVNFIKFLGSQEAKRILKKHGFEVQ